MQGLDSVLTVKNLTVTFAGKERFTAVRNLSFSIGKGKTLAIVGESGSGKSLTALALMDLLPKTASLSGEIALALPESADGINAKSQITNHKSQIPYKRGKDIGMVFQEPMSSLNPVMSVGKQLKEAIQIHSDTSNTDDRKLAIDWLGKVQLPAPEKMYHRYPHQLSGGQKQRVMIAMAMCNHPALLLADEPTTALDVTVQKEIIRLMDYLQQESSSAMIFITHDLSLASAIADDVLVMYKGEMMEYGAVSQVMTHPQHPYTKALIACKPSADKKGLPLPVVADFLEEKIERKIETKGLSDAYDVATDIAPLLEVKNLLVWFTEFTNLLGQPVSYFKAVDDVSFTIQKGEILGLVGESGCGKSTVSRCLAGLVPVHSGEILFKGKNLATLPLRDWREVRRDIQMIFQDPYSSLNPRMTIGDMLREPLRTHNIVPASKTQAEIKRLLALVHLPADSINRYPHQFSGGQRQRIGIARALSMRPQLLICDESVSALDVSIQAQILNLLKDLQKEFRLTYLFIAHDLSVVHYFSDRVMVMQKGKIIESGTAEQVLKQPKEAYTRQLIEAIPAI